MNTTFRKYLVAALTAIGLALMPFQSSPAASELDQGFKHPPDSARPWVYWFWLNSNITSNGITADLEAMKRVGIGGVLIMEVDQGAPVGPVAFMSNRWREMFKHVVAEAQRLGLEVNMNNDAGWNGSGGPWIKPEQSMQKVVSTETNLEGPRRFEGALRQPQPVAGFYRDITVLAFPTPGPYRIDNIKVKACYDVGHVGFAAPTNVSPEMTIDRARIVDLSAQTDQSGRLLWDVPPGRWTVLRFGHTSTGAENAPSPASGRGLECDKLSKEGIEANFAGMMGKLIEDVGPGAGKALVATHIDSWENGAQNWTARMREEFQKRRGYDLIPFLPTLTGRVVGTLELSERFLWDLRQTISDLVVENYAGHLQTLARQHGMKLSIEAYGGPCDDLPYAGRADEPMCEFWIGGGAFGTIKEMASSAHTYGKRILGAESFTADDREKWLEHPASFKALGDRAFCDGVNRFVFHRYALQPWAEDRRPGMTMGPWGLHYERTQTWWEWSSAWHQYLARCQFLLRQGLFVADLCYLQPEAAPQGFHGHSRNAYDYDNCSAEVVLTRMSVQGGRLLLPDGTNYRLLVLPEVRTMTPALLRKIRELVQAGATVVGPRPLKSPSLTDYPQCDEEVKRLADETWGDCDGKTVTEHRLGQGRVVWGVPPEKLLAQPGVQPDFTSRTRLRYIHRVADDADIYFVANPQSQEVEALASFRVRGKLPELWWPDSGEMERAAVFREKDGGTDVRLRLGPSGSVFVVFRPGATPRDPVLAVTRDGQPIWPEAGPAPKIVVQKAVYGVLNDPQRTREVRAKAQQLVDGGDYSFQVARMAEGDDPAPNVVKTLALEYTVGDRRFTVTGKDPDTVRLNPDTTQIVIAKASYGVLDDPKRTRDVRSKVQRMADAGEHSFEVARLAQGDDPAFGIVKTVVIEHTADGKRLTATGTDPDTVYLGSSSAAERIVELLTGADGRLLLEAWQPGGYEVKTASGQTRRVEIRSLPTPQEIRGAWDVRFTPGWGAPDQLTFDELTDWSKHAEAGVKYFSGVATYTKTISVPAEMLGANRRLYLDLGKVAVMAQAKLNGKDLGILWKPPFRADITDAAKAGENVLEVKVANLWVNRMIGDEQLPEHSARHSNGTLKEWPQWLLEGKPSPTGRYTFASWRLWKKDAPLQPSGLLGRVTLHATQRVPVE
jgi:hypothetical protein